MGLVDKARSDESNNKLPSTYNNKAYVQINRLIMKG